MTALLDHIVILPILLPLATGALLLFFDDRQRPLKAGINFASCALLLIVAVLLVMRAGSAEPLVDGATATYPLGNWPVPFGIVLVADRLSATLVLLTAALGGIPALATGVSGAALVLATVVLALATARAWAMPTLGPLRGRQITPLQVGLVEIGFSVAVLVACLLA